MIGRAEAVRVARMGHGNMGSGAVSSGDHHDIVLDAGSPMGDDEAGPGPFANHAEWEADHAESDASDSLLPYGAPGLLALSLLVVAAATVMLRSGEPVPVTSYPEARPALAHALGIHAGRAPEMRMAVPLPPPTVEGVAVVPEEAVPVGPDLLAVAMEAPGETQVALETAEMAEVMPPDEMVSARTQENAADQAGEPTRTGVLALARPAPLARPASLPAPAARPVVAGPVATKASRAVAPVRPSKTGPKPSVAVAYVPMPIRRTFAAPARVSDRRGPYRPVSLASGVEPRRKAIVQADVPARRPAISLPKALRPVED